MSESAFNESSRRELRLPVVGVQVAVFSDDAILLGKRKNIFGAGTWGLPGGHLEFGESFEGAAERELFEETGLLARKLRTFSSVNTPYEKTHYVQIGVEVLEYDGALENKEPDRCEALRFFKKDRLPSELFPPSVTLINQLFDYRTTNAHGATLCLYLICVDPDKRKNRFVNYILLESVPVTMIAKFGSRSESKPRNTRVFQLDTYDSALNLLKEEIAKRIKHGYVLYNCSGSLSVDQALALFPDNHPVALSSVSAIARGPSKTDLAAAASQMGLFGKVK